MKIQGADGLSRGHFKEGVCIWDLMLKYCPWGRFATERSPLLRSWLDDWLPNYEYLSPIDWYDKGHDLHTCYFDKNNLWRWNISSSTYVWDLSPGSTDAALEELRKARIKRQQSTHVVLVPQLFSHLWKRQMLKCCDLVIQIPAGQMFWSHDQFEPLTLGICFPFLPFRPWQLRHTPKLFSMERSLSKLFKEHSVDGGSFWRKFCLEARSWHTMPERLVWSLLYFKAANKFPSHEYSCPKKTGSKREGSNSIAESLETCSQKKRRV